MARDMSNFIRISIPADRLKESGVIGALLAVTEAAGGGTSHAADGAWVDAGGNLIQEPVRVFQWNYNSDDSERVDDTSRALVDVLFQHGEQAVLKERNYDSAVAYKQRTVMGYMARLLYAPTKH